MSIPTPDAGDIKAITYGLGRTWGNPDQMPDRTFLAHRRMRYALLWNYYDGTAYQDVYDALARQYKDAHNLPASIRQINNLVKKLCDFYYLHVYAGALPEEGAYLPGGQDIAIPLDFPDADSEDRIAPAIAQLNRWWGMVELAPVIVLQTAILGEVVVELEDDVINRKLLANIVWPGYIIDRRLDAAGNIKAYTKEYQAFDPEANDGKGESFTYTRIVDTKTIKTYKNHEPFAYFGVPATRPNPFGFVPARLFRHWNVGGWYGEPAIYGAQAAYDELNAMWSQWNDQIRLYLDLPVIISGNTVPGSVQRAIDEWYATQTQIPVADLQIRYARWKMIETEAGTDVKTPSLSAGDLSTSLQRILDGIHDLCPEVRFEEMLREMSNLTGPGAERAMLDVRTRYRTISARYDRGVKSLYQMGISMAAYHLQEGTWAASAATEGVDLGLAQDVFGAFTTDSYDKGEMAFDILPRDLVYQTAEERQAQGMVKIDAGVPRPIVLEENFGYDDKDFTDWEDRGLVARQSLTGVPGGFDANNPPTGSGTGGTPATDSLAAILNVTP